MAQKIRYILLQLFMSAVFIAFGAAIEKNGNLPGGFGMIYAVIPGGILMFNTLMNFISFKKAVVFPIVCLVICAVADIVATVIYKVKYPDFVSLFVVILSVLLTVLLSSAFYFLGEKGNKLLINFKLPKMISFDKKEEQV